MWSPDGDCLVHFYNKGHSRRGPSLRVHFESLKQAQCGPLFDVCLAQLIPHSNSQSLVASDNRSTGDDTPGSPDSSSAKYELYIPCPDDTPREEAFSYHLTTRNFFAWISGKPLVGSHLGKALVDLLERMMLFRNEEVDNVQDFTAYLGDSGYLDFGNCADYALAMLSFAEHFELRDLWIDAFVHSVGMNENLCLSTEFGAISRVTKALITRAYLEMDLHLGRVARAISNFLEDELSSSYLGLSEGARSHLDRFRSFLHSYYVNKFGYWPPPQGSGFAKPLYQSMYYEFSKLYSYLADTENVDIIQKAASGGICVLQNVEAFDGRHKYDPLPYQLPLLPDYEHLEKRVQSQKGTRALRINSRDAKKDRRLAVRTALAAATNSEDEIITSCSLVKEYIQFERELSLRQEEKVSVVDARKVRWLLIYSVVQMLISVIRAPPEVRDTEGPNYPLCCLTAGTPPWAYSSRSSLASPMDSPIVASPSSAHLLAVAQEPQELDSRSRSSISIHPDCESDNYFANIPFNRRADTDSTCVPRPLRPLHTRSATTASAPVIRTSSIKKSLHLPKRFSQRRAKSFKVPISVKPSHFCEILVHGYGNGLNKASVDTTYHFDLDVEKSQHSRITTPTPPFELDASPIRSTHTPERGCSPQPAIQTASFSEHAHEARTPILHAVQLDAIHEPLPRVHDPSPSTSESSLPLSWAEEAKSFSIAAISNQPDLSISIYDIAAATAAGRIPAPPPSSASSKYSRDSFNADSFTSPGWSTASASDLGSDPTSASSNASENAGHSRSSSLDDILSAVRDMNGALPGMDHASVGKASDSRGSSLSLPKFAKMLATEESSDCGDNAEKEVNRVDSMESLRAKYMNMDLFGALMSDFGKDIGTLVTP